jgi:putative flippase GtrA
MKIEDNKDLRGLCYTLFIMLRQASRYLVSGTITTGVMAALVFLFSTVLHIHYLIATAYSFVITICFSYLIHSQWTFHNKTPAHVKQFSQHGVLVVVTFFANLCFVYIFVSVLMLPPAVGQILSSGVLAIISFFVYTSVIFKNP